jgi:chemotaxis protein MotB
MAESRAKCGKSLPPWLATFADLMSLLMCFFVLLLSFAEIDAIRFKKMADSMRDAFGVQREITVTEIVKGVSVIKTEFSPSVTEPSPIAELRQETVDANREEVKIDDATREAVGEEEQERINEQIEEKVAELRAALAEEIERGLVSVEKEASRVLIRIREKGSFDSGSADLDIGFFRVMERISEAVAGIPGKVVVAGHTDDVPISTSRFRSNWELSSARAVTVVHSLLRNPSVDATRVVVEGHADSQPLAPNDTRDNRAKNRRVELILIRGEDVERGGSLETGNTAAEL